MWILWKKGLLKCEFCELWDFRNENFVKNDILKMWILWKLRFQKREFCENWDFKNVNFVKNEIYKIWILWKMRFWKCEFLDKIWNFTTVGAPITKTLRSHWGYRLVCRRCCWAPLARLNFRTYFPMHSGRSIQKITPRWQILVWGTETIWILHTM